MSWKTKDPDVADGGGAADSRRPGDDGQARRSGCCRGSPAPTRTWRSSGVPSLPFDVSGPGGAAGHRRSDHRRGCRGVAANLAEAACRLNGAAVFALGGEELGPGNHLGVLLEQGAALAFGHAAPDAELDAVVEGVGAAFEDHRDSAGRSRRLCAGRRLGRTVHRDRPGDSGPGIPTRSGPRPLRRGPNCGLRS